MRKFLVIFSLVAVGTSSGAATKSTTHKRHKGNGVEQGIATIYAQRFHGRRTASGERFDVNRRTAAHRTRPLGSHATVTNIRNGRSTCVRINDRGGFTRARIDLAPIAGRDVGITPHIGIGHVRIHSGC